MQSVQGHTWNPCRVQVSASVDGGDNLNDDTDAIVATATIFKLNPSLHVVSVPR